MISRDRQPGAPVLRPDPGAGIRARFHAWGGAEALVLEPFEAPPLRPGEVLVRTHAAALNPKDVLIRKGHFRRLSGSPPITPGFDFCGEIAAARGVRSGPSEGDEVFGMLGGMRGGALASWIRVAAHRVARTPPGWDPASLAAVPLAGLTALQALRDLGRVRPGSAVCINGASGGVGSFAVQIALRLGATVTTLSSASNRVLCRELGAHCALSYEDPGLLEGREFDVFFDVYGNRSARTVRRWMASDGRYVTTVPNRRNIAAHLATRFSLGQRARLVVVRHRSADLAWLRDELAAGRLRPMVDSVFALTDVRAAFERLETRHARGKVVVRIDGAVPAQPAD